MLTKNQTPTTEVKPMNAGYGITHTLEETARLLGITRERVRQIEKNALKKLRKRLKLRYGITSISEVAS
jgi:DNA-directed RNA polymerase sigma subunit (sigma70/sigma32)